MTGQSKPAAEMELTEALVRRLIAEQCPQYRHLPIESFAAGWDNAIFRLGEELLVRLPRREAAVALVVTEHRWLPELARRLPIRVPEPLVFGQPGDDYPWPWSIIEFVPGHDAIVQPPEPQAAVEVLAEFVKAMARPAPPDAPENAVRGVPLIDRDARTREHLAAIPHRSFDAAVLDRTAVLDADGSAVSAVMDGQALGRHAVDELDSVWERALARPRDDGPAVWLHGDLHPGNVVVHDGAIVSVVDFGDLTSGDPATDLGSAWMFFDRPARDRFRTLLEVDDSTWDRARGWALSVGLAIAMNSAGDPGYEALALRTLAAVVEV